MKIHKKKQTMAEAAGLRQDICLTFLLENEVTDAHIHIILRSISLVLVISKKITLNIILSLQEQGRRELLEAQGQNCEMRPPAGEASRTFFQSCSLDWLKMHFRALSTVKMLKIFNYEAP